MKILIINASHRKGNTDQITGEVRKKLEFSGFIGADEAIAIYNQIWAELH